MRYLARNASGKLIKGPWGEKPSDESELTKSRLERLAHMDPDEGAFEEIDTDAGVDIGAVIKLPDKDFATLSLAFKEEGGLSLKVYGELFISEDGMVGLPVFYVGIEMLDGVEFVVPLLIADSAEYGRLDLLASAAKKGGFNVCIGSSKRLFPNEFYFDDRETKRIVRKTIMDGIRLFKREPWTTEMEDDLFDDVFFDDEEDDKPSA